MYPLILDKGSHKKMTKNFTHFGQQYLVCEPLKSDYFWPFRAKKHTFLVYFRVKINELTKTLSLGLGNLICSHQMQGDDCM